MNDLCKTIKLLFKVLSYRARAPGPMGGRKRDRSTKSEITGGPDFDKYK